MALDGQRGISSDVVRELFNCFRAFYLASPWLNIKAKHAFKVLSSKHKFRCVTLLGGGSRRGQSNPESKPILMMTTNADDIFQILTGEMNQFIAPPRGASVFNGCWLMNKFMHGSQCVPMYVCICVCVSCN